MFEICSQKKFAPIKNSLLDGDETDSIFPRDYSNYNDLSIENQNATCSNNSNNSIVKRSDDNDETMVSLQIPLKLAKSLYYYLGKFIGLHEKSKETKN